MGGAYTAPPGQPQDDMPVLQPIARQAKRAMRYDHVGSRLVLALPKRMGVFMTRSAAMCEGKKPLTWCQARAILARRRSQDKDRAAYHCHVCRAWHVGQHPKRFKRT